MPASRCINIDLIDTWLPLYESFFADLAPPEVWARLLDPDSYSSADANIENLARFLAPHSRNSVNALNERIEIFFRSNFTHVTFYHACRITNPIDYERDGVRCADISEQNRRAEVLWGKSDALMRAISSVRSQGYSRHNHGRVGLWFSRDGAMRYGNGYTGGGSEYLRVVANHLSPEQKALLFTQGRPALIRCMLPLGEVDDSNIRSYSTLPLRWRLTWRDPEAPPGFYALGWAIMCERPIPADQIAIEYLDS